MKNVHFEKELVVNNRELNYKGIFRPDELFRVVNKAIEARGYEKREKRTEETVSESGKMNLIELRPFKEKTQYATLMINIKIILSNLTEVAEEVKGEKRLFQQGDVSIVFDAWSLTDYQGRWGLKPWVFFAKAIINKFLYKIPLESGFKGEVAMDTAYIYAHLKKLLNSYKEEIGVVVNEEEVKQKMQEEMKKEMIELEINKQDSTDNFSP
jgi:hypothetical protein